MIILMKFLYLFIYFLLFNLPLTCSKKKIKWKKVFLQTERETDDFVFGPLYYKRSKRRIYYFDYQNLSHSSTNKICGSLNFDDYFSFSIDFHVEKTKKAIKFDIKQKKKEKY